MIGMIKHVGSAKRLFATDQGVLVYAGMSNFIRCLLWAEIALASRRGRRIFN